MEISYSSSTYRISSKSIELCIHSICFVILEYFRVPRVLLAAEVQQLFHNAVYKQLCARKERIGNYKNKVVSIFRVH